MKRGADPGASGGPREQRGVDRRPVRAAIRARSGYLGCVDWDPLADRLGRFRVSSRLERRIIRGLPGDPQGSNGEPSRAEWRTFWVTREKESETTSRPIGGNPRVPRSQVTDPREGNHELNRRKWAIRRRATANSMHSNGLFTGEQPRTRWNQAADPWADTHELVGFCSPVPWYPSTTSLRPMDGRCPLSPPASRANARLLCRNCASASQVLC